MCYTGGKKSPSGRFRLYPGRDFSLGKGKSILSQPLVSIVMGSDSDLPLMREAAAVLEDLGIPYEAVIASAHRTPAEAVQLATKAAARGIRVIIAGAGGAAHLPGVIAAYTNLPVIGVPVKGDALSGMDSLYSIVQMPAGVPVAAMAINGAKNAGIFAAQILALEQEEIRLKLEQFKQNLADKVKTRNDRLQEIGVEKYLQGYQKKD